MRLGRVIKKTANNCEAYLKGFYIQIDREPDSRFYIIVQSPDGGNLYDGWWPNELDWVGEKPTMKEAISEAISGSQLLEPTQGKGVKS